MGKIEDNLKRQADRIIARAKENDISLAREDFTIFEGELYLDGMDPDEWLNVMMMD